MGDSKISNRDAYSEDNESVDSESNSNASSKKGDSTESERKIFVKHSIKRGVITGLVYALI